MDFTIPRLKTINPMVHNGSIVYVVVALHRNKVIQSSLIDNQPDVEVLGVFLSEQEATRYCMEKNPSHMNSLTIHQSFLRQGNFWRN